MSEQWTDERVDRLRELIATGLPTKDIRARLGLTRGQILGKMFRLGLQSPRVPWDDARTQRLRELAKQPLSYHQIAAELGVTQPTISRQMRRLGLDVGRPHGNAGRKRGVKQRKTNTLSDRERERRRDLQDAELTTDETDLLIPIEQRKALLELRQADCHWPVGDPTEPGFFFCGAPIAAHSPYCVSHWRRAINWPASEAGKPLREGG